MSNSNFGVSKLVLTSRDNPGKTAEITSVDSLDMGGLQTPLIQQKSGNNSFAVAVGTGEAEGTITTTIQQYSKELLEVVAPKEAIITSDNSGTPAINSANINGSSVLNATTGLIAGLKAGAEASLKAGAYIIIARSASTVDVIATTKNFKTLNGVLNASPLSISSGASVDVLDQDGNATGLELTGGSGTIAFVEGDYAKADVSKGLIDFNFSLTSEGGYCPRIFDLIAISSNYTTNAGVCKYKQIYLPKVSAIINPFGALTRNEFSPFELQMTKMAGTDDMEVRQIQK
jgi:hypothetical protein